MSKRRPLWRKLQFRVLATIVAGISIDCLGKRWENERNRRKLKTAFAFRDGPEAAVICRAI